MPDEAAVTEEPGAAEASMTEEASVGYACTGDPETPAAEVADTTTGQSIAGARDAMKAAAGEAAVQAASESTAADAAAGKRAAPAETAAMEAADTTAGQSIAGAHAAMKAAPGDTLSLGHRRNESQRASYCNRCQNCPIHQTKPISNEGYSVRQRSMAQVDAATRCPGADRTLDSATL